MANLVSPGVSVTITDESFFIPAAAATVPLFFIATADEKKRADGVTDAAGTFEHNVIRTVTSLKQSTELYGIPRFLEDFAGNPLHGDVRNEYGVFALNQYLGIGDLAYVVRANVNLNDNLVDIRAAWDTKMQESAYVLENLVNAYLNEWNAANGFVQQGGQTAIGTFDPIGTGAGSGYTTGTYTNVSLTGGTGSGATANITVAPSGINTLNTLVSGSGYTAGTYTNVPLTNVTVGTYTPTGTGATANVVVSAGAVVSVTMVNRGVGYQAGDTLSADTADLGLVGSGFSIKVASLAATITGLDAPVGGSGYIVGSYTNVPLTGGTGTGASADITVAGTAIGATIITNPGTTPYTNGTHLNVPLLATGTSVGTAAAANVTVVAGNVTSVVIVNAGTDWVAADTFTLDYSTHPTLIAGDGFVGTVSTLSGSVTAVTVVNTGVGYLDGDTLSALAVNLGGSGTSFSVDVASTSTGVTSVVLVNRGINYTIGDALTASIPPATGSGFAVVVATLTGYRTTVDETTLLSLATTATQSVWESFSFKNSKSSFMDDWTTAPKSVYASGYNNLPTGTFIGLTGTAADWVAMGLGSVVGDEWTAQEAGNTLLGASDAFKYTTDFLTQTSLGANDSARRVAVVEALQAAINSNTDIRSETYEYNLILCPGFPEVVDEMLNLCIDIQEEAMVIADTPFDKDPDQVAIWAATSDRRTSRNIAYYYPHGLASNLDGKDVFIAASGTALRTITYSDDVSELWFAPAGTRRGLVSGVSMVGYVSGTLGTATTFNEVALNQGQRNNLYKYFTNINPIVFFPGRGIIVWGQKTSAPDASALDRINVVRLMAYIKRQLRKNTMSYVFEPNDQLTRDNIKATVDSFLGDLIVKRGLYDFATVCDESNNTPDRIDRNEMYVDIALKPVRAAEFIYIPIRVVATGAQI